MIERRSKSEHAGQRSGQRWRRARAFTARAARLASAACLAGAACLALALLTSTAARSAEPPRIVLVANPSEDATMAQLRAELRTMGFVVAVVDALPTDGPREALERAARESSAVAAILVRPSPRAGIEVWVVDRITGKTLLRDVVETDPAAGRDATVALRAVELLRASLIEIDSPHPSRGEVPPTPELRSIVGLAGPVAPPPGDALPLPPALPSPTARPPLPAQPPLVARRDDGAAPRLALPSPAVPFPAIPSPAASPLFSVDVAPVIMGSPGGLAAFPAIELGVHAFFHPRISADLGGYLPFSGVRHKAAEGQSMNRITMFVAGARLFLARPTATFRPTLAAGAALLWLHTDGVGASADFIGVSNDGFTGAPFLRPGLSVALGSRLSLHADLLAGVAVRRLVLDYAGRDAATWGAPVLAGSLGVEISSP